MSATSSPAATTTVSLGNKTFVLDREKAELAYAGKRVINGKETMFFNILPLKYQWAYDLYKTMKNNHWEPEDVTMQKDVEQWRSDEISDVERWIIKMGIGYFSAAEGIVGDNVLHVVREVVTAPELKLVLGRHAHEENIHADSLVYMISSLGINPHECEAMFEDIPSIQAKNLFVTSPFLSFCKLIVYNLLYLPSLQPLTSTDFHRLQLFPTLSPLHPLGLPFPVVFLINYPPFLQDYLISFLIIN